MNKRLVVAASSAVLISLLLPSFAGADAESRKTAEKLVEALRVESSFDQNVQKLVLAQVQAQPGFQAYRDVLVEYYSRYIGWEAVKQDVIDEYDKAFTQAELVKLVEFYTSPLGSKSLSVAPRIEATAYSTGIERAEQNYAELQKLVDQKSEAMRMR